MNLNRIYRARTNDTFKGSRPKSRHRSARKLSFEPLEDRQLLSVTGFILVDEPSGGGKGTTVINQPTIFRSELQQTWQGLIDGNTMISGQTLSQKIASAIQSAEASQKLEVYNISSSFDGTPVYGGRLVQTYSGWEAQLTFDAMGNQTTFTSTTNFILGSSFDPTFHVTYDLDLTVDLSMPSNAETGKATVTANAVVSKVNVTTKNVIVGLLSALGVANIPQEIANDINGYSQNLSSLAPTGLLNTALQSQAAQGYIYFNFAVNSAGAAVMTSRRIDAATPVLFPGFLDTTDGTLVTISDTTPGASIRYTTNGSTPTISSTLYTGNPIRVDSTETIKAIAFATDYGPSAIASVTYKAPSENEPPNIGPGAGDYTNHVKVTINNIDGAGVIRYTTNGTAPTSTSPVYVFPINLKHSATVKAAVFGDSSGMSPVASSTYTIVSKGELNVSQKTAVPSYNLTSLGKIDWAHWGRNGQLDNFDEKAGLTQISNVTEFALPSIPGKALPPVYYYGRRSPSRSVRWSNGSPTSADGGDNGYLTAQGELASFSFTVQALPTTQTLYIYAGGQGSAISLQAQLSDRSAPVRTVNAKHKGSKLFTDVFAITFRAGSAARVTTLNVTYGNSLSGTNADLIAAWLA
jgi:Chitobiase/beta-hexosaminidase C-terminal domain